MPKKHKHHEIPLWKLVLPGACFFVSIVLILLGLRELAFLIVGLAIIAMFFIHWEED